MIPPWGDTDHCPHGWNTGPWQRCAGGQRKARTASFLCFMSLKIRWSDKLVRGVAVRVCYWGLMCAWKRLRATSGPPCTSRLQRAFLQQFLGESHLFTDSFTLSVILTEHCGASCALALYLQQRDFNGDSFRADSSGGWGYEGRGGQHSALTVSPAHSTQVPTSRHKNNVHRSPHLPALSSNITSFLMAPI